MRSQCVPGSQKKSLGTRLLHLSAKSGSDCGFPLATMQRLNLTGRIIYRMYLPPAGCPNNYELRLAERFEGNEIEGRIELCLNGEWRILCQNGVDIPDITVMCRELGYEPISTSLYSTSSLLKKGMHTGGSSA